MGRFFIFGRGGSTDRVPVPFFSDCSSRVPSSGTEGQIIEGIRVGIRTEGKIIGVYIIIGRTPQN